MTATVAATKSQDVILSTEVVNKINELVGLDRSLLSSDEKTNELASRLRNKIDTLRDNFIVSMPFEFNKNEGGGHEFGALCVKIENLNCQYATLKNDHTKIRTLIDEYKRKRNPAIHNNEDDEEKLRNLVARYISIQRYLIYISTLIKLNEFR